MTTPRRRGSGIVVVGASVAGVAAVDSMRDHGFSGPITLIDPDPDTPYDRPPLSKQLLSGEWDAARLRLVGPEWSALRRVRRIVAGATGLDPESRTLRTSQGEIPYEGLIVSTGSRPRELPLLPPGPDVHYLRTLADGLTLRESLVPGARLVVIGAGFVGMEVAATARSRGVSVDVVDPLPAPLSRVLGEHAGNLIAKLHADHDVRLHLGLTVIATAVVPDGRRLVLDDGTRLTADLVLVGVGAAPVTDWLTSSGLTVTDGVLCDPCLVAADGVAAAGDVARWPHPKYGEMRVEHWTNAREQGALAAQSLLTPPGDRSPYDAIPYVWSDQYDTRIQLAGRPTEDARHLDEVTLYVQGDRLLGVLAINAPKAFLRARRALIRATPVGTVLRDLAV